ncbi:hypothetical protein C0583_05230 [Candidatus Parcubacteria bacterium]|nr:MAG: hypothetical protein C0583_05230 [Candidatus Parcubacteria bacterium]
MKLFSKILLVVFIFSPYFVQAAMVSDSYVIYENVHHYFDGPVISGESASSNANTVTVTWTTDVASDSFVVYDTDPSVPESTSHEQGKSPKTETSHSVMLTGLAYSTTYYYKVKSTRVNGGTSESSSILSFSTGANPDASTEQESSGGGGGMLIIDKTDKEAPEISNVVITAIDSSSARITWETNEEATSFVEYGFSINYGNVYGEWGTTTEHEVVLDNLESDVIYHYRALSSDSWGNLGKSADATFALIPGEDDEVEIVEEPEDVEEVVEEDEEEEEPVLERVTDTALELLRRIFPNINLNELTDEQLQSVDSVEDLSDFAPVPIMSGQPRIDVGADQATVYWTTDLESNSQVAISPEDRYRPESDEPYYQIIGNTQDFSTEHEVTIYSLQPDTTYHFQLRSKPELGPTAVSNDYTFTTNLEGLSIESFFTQVISNEEAAVKWVTNKEANSEIRYAPYQNGQVNYDEKKVLIDNNSTVIHEMTMNDLQEGVYYIIEIYSTDDSANVTTETINRFSTADTDEAPEISHVKADSTVFLDKSNKTQTIISWLTNEPATSKVYYQEGVHGSEMEFAESTDLKDSYTKEHVMVITKFKPGVVYSFRVESVDSGGNTSISKVHTFMTAKQRESIIQIIIGIFEDTFGWVKKLM